MEAIPAAATAKVATQLVCRSRETSFVNAGAAAGPVTEDPATGGARGKLARAGQSLVIKVTEQSLGRANTLATLTFDDPLEVLFSCVIN